MPTHLTLTLPIAASTTDMTPGRLAAIAAALTALAGITLGTLSLTHRAGHQAARAALATGLFAITLGTAVAATADGGLGTGNGLGGAYVAVLLGAAATALGALTLRRARAT